jgi:TonB family protein
VHAQAAVLGKPGTVFALVDPSGRSVPLAATESSHWADGSVRWLLLDLQIRGLAAGSHELTLLYGHAVGDGVVVVGHEPPQGAAPGRPGDVVPQHAGPVALDQLADLRDLDVDTRADAKALNAGAGEKTRVDRALLTARAGEGSGGIAVGKVSSGFGGGSTGLKGVATARVASSADAAPAADTQRSGKSSRAARTREEVELVFDRNKSAIYAIYSRALRDNPALQGKVVLEVSIAPSGEVTDCRIVSSELGDAELERKLVARVRMFRFEARDVAPMTTTKPIEFFPA